MEKQDIIVVGEDKDIIALLGYKYNIKEIIPFQAYLEKLVTLWEGGKSRTKIADFIVVGNEIKDEFFDFPPNQRTKDANFDILQSIYNINKDIYFQPPTTIGFGNGALALAKLNKADLLYDISNHNKVTHLTSFVMQDDKVLEFDVTSNHRHLIIPNRRNNFDVLAFSTYNNSQSYTRADGTVFKATRDFIEIEALKLPLGNSYCFLYDAPKEGESVLIDLTLQLLTK